MTAGERALWAMAEAERIMAVVMAVGTAAFVLLALAVLYLLFEERIKRWF